MPKRPEPEKLPMSTDRRVRVDLPERKRGKMLGTNNSSMMFCSCAPISNLSVFLFFTFRWPCISVYLLTYLLHGAESFLRS